MRKEYMSPQQLEQRQTVVSLLTEANWQPAASNRLFDQGQYVRAEAEMTFQHDSVELGCRYFAASQRLKFGMYDPEGRGLSISFATEERLDELIRKIISIQDAISPQTFQDIRLFILKDFPEASTVEFGNQQDALGWISSSKLDELEREELSTFVRGFPSLKYYRFVDEIDPDIAPWLVEVHKAIGGFEPGKSISVQLSGFELDVIYPNPVNTIWYNQWFTTEISSEFESLYLHGDQLIVVYAWLRTLGSLLAIKANQPNDRQVYNFHYEDIKMKDEEKRIGYLDYAEVVCEAYTQLFTYITKIRAKQDGSETIVYSRQEPPILRRVLG